MSRTFIDIHILQTVPPSNLNRDDTGSPKSAIYGGIRRARVSSQAWKRVTRKSFKDELDAAELGVRSKQLVRLLAERITARSGNLEERAEELAKAVLNAVGIKKIRPSSKDGPEESEYLVFFSAAQLEAMAQQATEAAGSEDVVAELKRRKVKELADRDHSVDLALFGRMVAEVPELNVDAAAQVAHAIAVHGTETEYDYYTAVDDTKQGDEETGAGMIGAVEFNSATLYRYATVDVNRLHDNLGDADATRRAVEAFVKSFVTSMPTGKQNSFANRTLPDAVVVRVRETQPINLVGAFEAAVGETTSTGRVREASDRLAKYVREVEESFDESPVAAWVIRVGDRTKALSELGDEVNMPGLVEASGRIVADRLES